MKLIKYIMMSILAVPVLLSANEPSCPPDMPPPPPPPRKCPPHRDGGERFKRFLNTLPEAEQKKLLDLQKNNPSAFREEMRCQFQKMVKKNFDQLLVLREKALKSPDPKEREEAKAQLKAKMTAQFNRNLNAAERRIKESEEQIKLAQQRLEAFRKEYQNRKSNADAMIRKQVDEFLDPAKTPVLEFPKHPGKRGKDMKHNLPPPPDKGPMAVPK